MTAWPSRPWALARLPISLAKVTLRACQALSAYLAISASSRSVWTSGAPGRAATGVTRSRTVSSSAPTTTLGGSR